MHESPPSTPTQHVLLAVAHAPALPHSICPGVTGRPPSGTPPLLEAPELLPLLEPAPELELLPMPELDPELDPLELPAPELEPPELPLPPAGACDDPPHAAKAATTSDTMTTASATGE
jgi:hypothetical protein